MCVVNEDGFNKPKKYHNQATVETVNTGIAYYVAGPEFGYEGLCSPVAGSVSELPDCDMDTGEIGTRESMAFATTLWVTCTASRSYFSGKFTRCSLWDDGVIHQTYNDRLAFLTEKSARHYAETGDILQPKGTNMKKKLIKKLSKYAIDLSGDRQKLKQFIKSKGWPIWKYTQVFTKSGGDPLIQFDGYNFCGTDNSIHHRPIITIDDFIHKFSTKCERRVMELEAQFASITDPKEL